MITDSVMMGGDDDKDKYVSRKEMLTTTLSYSVVGTPTRCAHLHKAAVSRNKTLWHGTPSEFRFSDITVQNLTKTMSSVQHPAISRWANGLQRKEDQIQTLVKARFVESVDQLWLRHREAFMGLTKEVQALDYACTCSLNSNVHRHTRPTFDRASQTPSYFRARQLRHPVVEIIHDKTPHVPNDITVGMDATGVLLYGMNAAGKSCLMKALALAVVMAQAGMHVACEALDLSPFHRIFTRIQSHDDMARGQSTFMVEMSELRSILKRCDSKSLVIGDEVCSGTESVCPVHCGCQPAELACSWLSLPVCNAPARAYRIA
jgi:DNA mismatch repair protein MutS